MESAMFRATNSLVQSLEAQLSFLADSFDKDVKA